jgi:hypothetical protein
MEVARSQQLTAYWVFGRFEHRSPTLLPRSSWTLRSATGCADCNDECNYPENRLWERASPVKNGRWKSRGIRSRNAYKPEEAEHQRHFIEGNR